MNHFNPSRNSTPLTILSLGAVTLLLLACEGHLGFSGSSSEHSGTDPKPPTSNDSPGTSGSVGQGEVTGPEDTSTPLARLTNGEFVNSAKALLMLPQDAKLSQDAEKSLAAEPTVRGLTNDAHSQHLTRVALAGYSTFADALADTYLSGVESQEDLAERLKCEELGGGVEDLDSCIRNFAKSLLPGAYRRDVTSQELSEVVGLLDEVDKIITDLSEDPESLSSYLLRVKTSIRQILLSPNFLLLIEHGENSSDADPKTPLRLSGFEIAARLSYFATASSPDAELLDLARQGTLADPQVRLAQTTRLLNSETGKEHFVRTLANWLAINPEVASQNDINELYEFIGQWFSQELPFSDFYQGSVSVQHVDESTTEEPFGVLGTRAFIVSHSTYPTPAFITRGVFVVESLLCGQLPDDVPAAAIDGAEATELEIFENHAKQPCATCHVAFDSYGAAFQQFSTESGLYDPSDYKLGADFPLFNFEGISGTVTDLYDLGATFGASKRAPECMAELWYRHALRRGFNAAKGDQEALDGLMIAWSESENTSMKSLLRTIVASDDFITLVR